MSNVSIRHYKVMSDVSVANVYGMCHNNKK